MFGRFANPRTEEPLAVFSVALGGDWLVAVFAMLVETGSFDFIKVQRSNVLLLKLNNLTVV